MKVYKKVLIYSVIVYILGIIIGPFSALIFPNTTFRWKESLLISTPALFLISVVYLRQYLVWKTYKYLLLGFGLASLILFFFQGVPTIIPVLIILAIVAMFLGSHPKAEKVISAIKSAL